jgi:hypothetical protein
MERRRFPGIGAAVVAAALATGCSDHEKNPVPGAPRNGFGKGLGRTGKGNA